MLEPCSANVRATSSSRRGRSQESTAIWTRKLWLPPPSHSTGVNRSGLRRSARTFGQSPRRVVIPVASEVDPAGRALAAGVVGGGRRAARREAAERVLDAVSVDAVAVAAGSLPRPRLLDRRLLLGDLADLELLENLGDDPGGGQLPGAGRN